MNQRRNAWGSSLTGSRCVTEWELGSRVTADLLSENHCNKQVAMGAIKIRSAFITGLSASQVSNGELAFKFTGKYLGVEDDNRLFFCHAITVDGKLVCSVDPIISGDTEEKVKWWYVSPQDVFWYENE